MRALALALAFAFTSIAWLGCSDGGGGSSAARTADDPAPAQPPPPPPDTGTSVSRVFAVLAWAPATGPVKGYRVFVERNGNGSFLPQEDVPGAAVVIEGDVGETFRMQVAALDDQGNEGPRSPASKQILFTDRMPPANGSSAAALASADADGSAQQSDAPAQRDPEPSRELASAPAVTGDLDGDGRADLLWESQDGLRLRITAADLATWLELDRPGADWSLAGEGDVDADGLSDLWWESATGEVAITRGSLLLTRPTSVPLEPWAKLEAGEVVENVADYDGDGYADALVSDADGGTLWLTRDSVFELAPLAAPEPDAQRKPFSGDLDGDGNVDLVWTLASGDLLVQFLVGGRVDAVDTFPAGGDPIGSLDADGDGADELLFRQPTGLSTQALRGAEQLWSVSLPDAATLVGCADYDADGTADLLWHVDGALHFVYLPGDEEVGAEPGWTALPLCR
jgi:hypothetical protein